MRAVVTGARGFVGREVVRLLDEAGGHRVTAVDAEVDLRDVDAVRALLRRARPEVLLHLGGVSGPMVSADDPALVTAVNAVGTIGLLDAAARLAEPPRVVLASSIAAVESSAGSPRTVYAATKRFIEDSVDGFRSRGLDIVVARLGSVYGAGRRTGHIVADLARSIVGTGVAEYDPGAVEPLVHVHDAARLLVALALPGRPAAPLYTVVQRRVPHDELATLIGRALAIPYESRSAVGPRLWWAEPLDSSQLLRDTGAGFSVPVADGVAEMARAAVRA